MEGNQRKIENTTAKKQGTDLRQTGFIFSENKAVETELQAETQDD